MPGKMKQLSSDHLKKGLVVFSVLFYALLLWSFSPDKRFQDDSIKKASYVNNFRPDTVFEQKSTGSGTIIQSFKEFPSLHPLIVHFAIVMIIVAAILQLINMFVVKSDIAWIIFGLLVAGLLAAYISANTVHPHTGGLSNQARRVLEMHDTWSDRTIFTATCATIVQFITVILVFRRRGVKEGHEKRSNLLKRILMIISAVIIVIAAYSVTRTGHYGAQLVHIEGVGPQGRFLRAGHHD